LIISILIFVFNHCKKNILPFPNQTYSGKNSQWLAIYQLINIFIVNQIIARALSKYPFIFLEHRPK